jgi:hypothetical protein
MVMKQQELKISLHHPFTIQSSKSRYLAAESRPAELTVLHILPGQLLHTPPVLLARVQGFPNCTTFATAQSLILNCMHLL